MASWSATSRKRAARRAAGMPWMRPKNTSTSRAVRRP
jgi:hypothetical protein